MSDLAIYNYAMSDLERMAAAFAQSKLFGVQTPEQALALCLIAQAEGRHPASAANDYNIISGRPSKKAEAMLRDFMASGGKVEWHALTDEAADATFSHPQGGVFRCSWDMARKVKAGINSPMWAKYPRQMLRSRCVSEGVRTVCPAATSGMYEPSEAADFAPEVETLRDVTPVRPAKAPTKASRALEATRDEPETHTAVYPDSERLDFIAEQLSLADTLESLSRAWKTFAPEIAILDSADRFRIEEAKDKRKGELAGEG